DPHLIRGRQEPDGARRDDEQREPRDDEVADDPPERASVRTHAAPRPPQPGERDRGQLAASSWVHAGGGRHVREGPRLTAWTSRAWAARSRSGSAPRWPRRARPPPAP